MGHASDDWGLESVDPSHTSSTTSNFRRVVERVNRSAKCRFCLWVVAIWCACTVLFMLLGYDFVVDKVAMGHIVLQEGGGQKYDAWRQAPVPVYYRVMVFNLTNPKNFMRGARPRVTECGPYVYRMMEEKIEVEFHENGTVSYRTKPVYLFQPSLSNGREDDIITTVNIPLVNAADAVKENPLLKTIIKVARELHGFKTLRHLAIRELLWGYESHVMNWARTMQSVPYPHPQFGLLVGFNNTAQEPYTMYTGGSDPKFINTIYAWNGKTELDFWSDELCNKIKGTDASGFHPNVQTTDKLYIFNGQLCRSMPLVYQKTVVHSGVETYRFVYPKSTFSYGQDHPENQCFCGKDGCPPQGLLDMKPCYWGAAIAFSFPHFYQADPTLRHVVLGLRPEKDLHETHFDIYPKLGVPLRVKLRMQMNIILDKNQDLRRARHFDIVFPVFWFEAGIDSLPNDMVGMLKMAQNIPPVIKGASIVIFASIMILFFIILFASCNIYWIDPPPAMSRSLTPENLPDNHWTRKSTQYSNYENSASYKHVSDHSLTPADIFSEDAKRPFSQSDLPDFQNLPSLAFNIQDEVAYIPESMVVVDSNLETANTDPVPVIPEVIRDSEPAGSSHVEEAVIEDRPHIPEEVKIDPGSPKESDSEINVVSLSYENEGANFDNEAGDLVNGEFELEDDDEAEDKNSLEGHELILANSQLETGL